METVDILRGRIENTQSNLLSSIPFRYRSPGERAFFSPFYGVVGAPIFFRTYVHPDSFVPMQNIDFTCSFDDSFECQRITNSYPNDCYGRRLLAVSPISNVDQIDDLTSCNDCIKTKSGLWVNSIGMGDSFVGMHADRGSICPVIQTASRAAAGNESWLNASNNDPLHCGFRLAENSRIESRDAYNQLDHFKQADFDYLYRAVASDDALSIPDTVDEMVSNFEGSGDVEIKQEPCTIALNAGGMDWSRKKMVLEEELSMHAGYKCRKMDVNRVLYHDEAEQSSSTHEVKDLVVIQHLSAPTDPAQKIQYHKGLKDTTRKETVVGSAQSSGKRHNKKDCEFPGCHSRARLHQRCKKHGGAHRCAFTGCQKNSQSRGLCIAHGGGSRCKYDGCTRASQSKGLCKSHGGGENCAVAGCIKKAHLKHLCRNHGGGVRCKEVQCFKWAQRRGWCMAHAKEHLGS